jgi:hypothetical protein
MLLRRRPLRLCEMTAALPLGGICDCAIAPVIPRGPAPRGAGDQEVVLFVAAGVNAPDAPQRGGLLEVSYFALVVMSMFSEFVLPG